MIQLILCMFMVFPTSDCHEQIKMYVRQIQISTESFSQKSLSGSWVLRWHISDMKSASPGASACVNFHVWLILGTLGQNVFRRHLAILRETQLQFEMVLLNCRNSVKSIQ